AYHATFGTACRCAAGGASRPRARGAFPAPRGLRGVLLPARSGPGAREVVRALRRGRAADADPRRPLRPLPAGVRRLRVAHGRRLLAGPARGAFGARRRACAAGAGRGGRTPFAGGHRRLLHGALHRGRRHPHPGTQDGRRVAGLAPTRHRRQHDLGAELLPRRPGHPGALRLRGGALRRLPHRGLPGVPRPRGLHGADLLRFGAFPRAAPSRPARRRLRQPDVGGGREVGLPAVDLPAAGNAALADLRPAAVGLHGGRGLRRVRVRLPHPDRVRAAAARHPRARRDLRGGDPGLRQARRHRAPADPGGDGGHVRARPDAAATPAARHPARPPRRGAQGGPRLLGGGLRLRFRLLRLAARGTRPRPARAQLD
ncbi:MAG: hypothetical protein AVDCRST_MAG04-634, partial [uncultured Acetobacteraceae bacterium]